MSWPSFASPRLLLAISVAAASLPAAAISPSSDDEERVEEIRVHAHPIRARSDEVAQPVTILSGEALTRRLAPSLGETVDGQPGIHSSYFGPAVGRPVIRGLSGPRVKVLEDGIAAMDASTTSGDHATSVEPFLADRIEILKGPATVLYGSGAIGGVVNAVSGRVPDRVPDAPLEIRAEVRAGDVADERSAAFRADGGGGRIAWHLDALTRHTDEFEIPGRAESAALRQAEAAEADHDEAHEEDAASGVLPNSDLDTESFSSGLGWIGDDVRIGYAVNRFETGYGLPGGHGHGEEHEGEHEEEEGGEHEEGDVRIELVQSRHDLQLAWTEPFAGIDELRFRGAWNDYRHEEIEGNGEIGTRFDNEAFEGRLELLNAPVAGFAGALGLQYESRDFSAVGEEAFVVPVERDALAAFLYQARSMGTVRVDFGTRAEWVELDPENGSPESFDVFSLAGGVVWQAAPNLSVALQADLAGRAPQLEELFSDGPHLATDTFEVGDPDLDVERALNLTFTVDAEFERFSTRVSLYRTEFSDFIHLRDTGLEEDGLPVRQWTQGDARFTGAEASVLVPLLETATLLDLRITGDLVRARLDDAPAGGSDHLPRIPPARLAAALEFSHGALAGEVSLTRVMRQDETADLELPTDAWTDLDLYLGWHLDFGRSHVELFARGSNLLDVEQRAHTSFLKDRAPLPGRSLQAGVRYTF
jgi:iron complex outermembrane receptor protein